jgi:hypothetical protein
MKKVLWFPIMVLAIPLDIILWNLIFGTSYGFRTPKQCFDENFQQWKNLNVPTDIK